MMSLCSVNRKPQATDPCYYRTSETRTSTPAHSFQSPAPGHTASESAKRQADKAASAMDLGMGVGTASDTLCDVPVPKREKKTKKKKRQKSKEDEVATLHAARHKKDEKKSKKKAKQEAMHQTEKHDSQLPVKQRAGRGEETEQPNSNDQTNRLKTSTTQADDQPSAAPTGSVQEGTSPATDGPGRRRRRRGRRGRRHRKAEAQDDSEVEDSDNNDTGAMDIGQEPPCAEPPLEITSHKPHSVGDTSIEVSQTTSPQEKWKPSQQPSNSPSVPASTTGIVAATSTSLTTTPSLSKRTVPMQVQLPGMNCKSSLETPNNFGTWPLADTLEGQAEVAIKLIRLVNWQPVVSEYLHGHIVGMDALAATISLDQTSVAYLNDGVDEEESETMSTTEDEGFLDPDNTDQYTFHLTNMVELRVPPSTAQ
eukprot:m.268714 g.268714  ORF g.268714 m.268714 type:complete len:423 (-) comp15662_c0_seq1:4309-5577(-)